eukprot:m.72490 g.72490  ORF g.72490 m.72490 type:complete len:68 (+) comp16102_c0_seq2:364-567(+)
MMAAVVLCVTLSTRMVDHAVCASHFPQHSRVVQQGSLLFHIELLNLFMSADKLSFSFQIKEKKKNSS